MLARAGFSGTCYVLTGNVRNYATPGRSAKSHLRRLRNEGYTSQRQALPEDMLEYYAAVDVYLDGVNHLPQPDFAA